MIVDVIGGLNWMVTAAGADGFVTQREREYVEAARCLGGPWRIIRHILPNTLSPIIVAGTLSVGTSMLAESTLSFLEYQVPARHSDLGPSLTPRTS